MLRGLVLLIFVNFAFSAAITNLLQLTNTTSILPTSPNPVYECLKPTIFIDKRPPADDCLHAIYGLPLSNNAGAFHISGEPDEFSLPVTRFYGQCRVRVDLNRFYYSETSSWVAIRAAAYKLSGVCKYSGDPPRTGGWIMTGKNGRIKITLSEVAAEVVSGNTTVVVQESNRNENASEVAGQTAGGSSPAVQGLSMNNPTIDQTVQSS